MQSPVQKKQVIHVAAVPPGAPVLAGFPYAPHNALLEVLRGEPEVLGVSTQAADFREGSQVLSYPSLRRSGEVVQSLPGREWILLSPLTCNVPWAMEGFYATCCGRHTGSPAEEPMVARVPLPVGRAEVHPGPTPRCECPPTHAGLCGVWKLEEGEVKARPAPQLFPCAVFANIAEPKGAQRKSSPQLGLQVCVLPHPNSAGLHLYPKCRLLSCRCAPGNARIWSLRTRRCGPRTPAGTQCRARERGASGERGRPGRGGHKHQSAQHVRPGSSRWMCLLCVSNTY